MMSNWHWHWHNCPKRLAIIDTTKMDKFELSKCNHSVLAQYYRWYQVYEIAFSKARIENQKSILTGDVEIISQAGTLKGKDNLEERLKVYEGWQNAHHMQHTQVECLENGLFSLEADIIYQNIRPDNSRYSYTIHYSTLLRPIPNELPLFSYVKIVPTGNIDNPEFKSTYLENRAMSFINYWLYLMETLEKDKHKFKDVLSKDFQFSLDPAKSISTFEQWFTARSGSYKKILYIPTNIVVKENGDQSIRVSLDLEWEGVTHDEVIVIGKEQNNWILENDPDIPFATLKNIDVVQSNESQY
jgi:hypothetical protein